MAETKIEWTATRLPDGRILPGFTFNPVTGCQKVGPGCDNCYAEGWAKRSGLVKWGPGAERRVTSDAYWRQPIKWNREAESEGHARFVFCASLADVFDNAWPVGVRNRLADLVRATPNLIYLFLTKRIGNAAAMLAEMFPDGIPSNVWIGATIVNRAEMLRDAPKLKAISATVRFWSVEPLLGDLGEIPRDLLPEWVIVGGESGPNARPMHPDHARKVRDQCAAAGVSFFFKQWGEWAPLEATADRAGKITGQTPRAQWHDACGLIIDTPAAEDPLAFFSKGQVLRIGKKAAGRLLDGRTWDEMPGAAL